MIRGLPFLEDTQLTIINTFWIGDRLGEVHAACLRSFLRHGYRVVLHCFAPPSDVPEGVALFPAESLMKRSEIIAHKLWLTADIYRYRILREGMGTYVDADVFCLRPLPEDDYLIGFEGDRRANVAVLRIPPGWLLNALLAASQNPYYIPQFGKRRAKRIIAHVRKAIGFPVHVSRHPFGILGPRLMTHLIMTHGLQQLVQPIDVLYPLHYDEVSLLSAPGLRLADLVTPRSCTIHLFNGALKGRPILPGTPLHEIISAT
jgi:hypothetical protein